MLSDRLIPPLASNRLSASGVLLLALLLGLGPAAEAQDPAAERLFREAERLQKAGDGDAAIAEFELLSQQFPGDALRPRALLAMARLRKAQGDLNGAKVALDALLAGHPRTPEAADAFYLQADFQTEEARLTTDLETARATFRRVPLLYGAESFPDLPARPRARLRSAEIGLALGDAETAAAESLAVIEDDPSGPWSGQARLLHAHALLRQGEDNAAIEVLQALASGRADDGAEANYEEGHRAQANRLLTLIYRHRLGPQAGKARYSRSERWPKGGTIVQEPEGVAADEDGRLLVIDGKTSKILRLDAEGRVTDTRSVTKPGRPGWIGGTAFVVTDEQIVLPFDGQRTGFLEPRSNREVPLDDLLVAERGLFGHWYVLAKGWKSLLAFESRRVGQELLAKDRPDFKDLALDHQGRLLILDRKAGRVGRLSHDRRWEGSVVQGDWRRPKALAVDPLGYLYVLDESQRQISVYSPEGRRLISVGPTLSGGIELKSPEDIAVDGSGRLFIADSDLPFIVVVD